MPACIITGANSGIGLALAEHYYRGGWHVIGIDIDVTGTFFKNIAISKIDDIRLDYRMGDVRDICSMNTIFRELKEKYSSGVDILFANAGILHEKLEEQFYAGYPCQVMATNYFGVINTITAASNILISNSAIVVSSSISSLLASPNSGPYAASKAAIDRWLEALLLRRSKNCQSPSIIIARIGFVTTPMTKGLSHAKILAISSNTAANKIAKGVSSSKNCIWVSQRSIIIFTLLGILGLGCRVRLLQLAYRVKLFIEARSNSEDSAKKWY
jgi:NAD(P)-dependent dehydrogenase (short-subunit alcohol dehydrogenase family)